MEMVLHLALLDGLFGNSPSSSIPSFGGGLFGDKGSSDAGSGSFGNSTASCGNPSCGSRPYGSNPFENVSPKDTPKAAPQATTEVTTKDSPEAPGSVGCSNGNSASSDTQSFGSRVFTNGATSGASNDAFGDHDLSGTADGENMSDEKLVYICEESLQQQKHMDTLTENLQHKLDQMNSRVIEMETVKLNAESERDALQQKVHNLQETNDSLQEKILHLQSEIENSQCDHKAPKPTPKRVACSIADLCLGTLSEQDRRNTQRQLSLALHPDKLGGQKTATQLYQELQNHCLWAH